MQSRDISSSPDPAKYVLINGGRHEGISFAGRRLVTFTPVGALFIQCDFNRLDVEHMTFGGGVVQTEYQDCVFDGAKLRMGAVGQARFVACSFRDVAIRRMECAAVEFIDCTFSGSIRSGFIKAKTPVEDRAALGRERNEVTGNDFSGARLTDFYFEQGVDLTRQRLPRSDDYLYLPDGPAAAEAARRALADCPADLQRPAKLVIRFVEGLVAEGQQQIWFRTKELFPKHREAVTWVLDFWNRNGYAMPPP